LFDTLGIVMRMMMHKAMQQQQRMMLGLVLCVERGC
jgi:hypothetical protein